MSCEFLSCSYSSRTGLSPDRLSHSQEHMPVSIWVYAPPTMILRLPTYTTIQYSHSVSTNMDMQLINRWTLYFSPLCQVWKQALLHGALTWNVHVLRTASSPQQGCITPVYLISHCSKHSLWQENIPAPFGSFYVFHVLNWMFPLCGTGWMSGDICTLKNVTLFLYFENLFQGWFVSVNFSPWVKFVFISWVPT